jgi:raffinose/stachyose/melibiose transport system substrate-binding protein
MLKRIASIVLIAITAVSLFGQKAQAKSGGAALDLIVYGAATADAFNDLAARYKAETGVTLDIKFFDADEQTVLRSAINSGNIPDLFMTSAYADNVGYKDYSYDLSKEDFIKKLQPAALSGVTLDGKITGYPFVVQSYTFIYNKKLFRDAGITSLPKTIADYETAARKLQAKGIQPFAAGFKEWSILPQTAWGILAPTIQEKFGGFDKFVDQLNKGTVKFSSIKEMDSLFDLLDLIKKYGGVKPLESDYNDQLTMLATGKAAIIHQGDWCETQMLKINPGLEIGLLLTPVAASPAKAGIMMDSNVTLRVYKDGKNLKESVAFLRWLSTAKSAKAWYEQQAKALSAVKGDQTAPSIIGKEALSAIAKGAPAYPWYYQRFPTGLEQGLAIVLQGYVAGQTDRKQTLAALDSTYAKAAEANR